MVNSITDEEDDGNTYRPDCTSEYYSSYHPALILETIHQRVDKFCADVPIQEQIGNCDNGMQRYRPVHTFLLMMVMEKI
jgi:hypothetical protein